MTPADLIPILDQEPWALMAAIADACEEQGETHLAAGWRWLAMRQKHPIGSMVGWFWMRWHVDTAGASTYHLDVSLCDLMADVNRRSNYHPSCSAAIAAAAQALAALSQRGVDLETLR